MNERVAVVSSRGQVVIPQEIRSDMMIEKGTRLQVIERQGEIVMRPVKKLSEMEGMLSGTRKSSKKIVDEVRKEWDFPEGDENKAA